MSNDLALRDGGDVLGATRFLPGLAGERHRGDQHRVAAHCHRQADKLLAAGQLGRLDFKGGDLVARGDVRGRGVLDDGRPLPPARHRSRQQALRDRRARF